MDVAMVTADDAIVAVSSATTGEQQQHEDVVGSGDHW
jgi:hypothetical protein